MRALLAAVVLLTAGPAAAGAIVSGVAAAGHGERCVAFPAGAVAVGDAVTLVGSESESSWWSAVVTVQRELAACAELDEASMEIDGADESGDVTVDGRFYELSAPAGADPYSWVAIAVPGAPRLRKVPGGFTAELDGRAPREHLHICATYQGLDLTIWSGPPFTGRRRTHGYYYLGYDVDPTCADLVAAERERLRKE
jgi:hypothetical protein